MPIAIAVKIGDGIVLGADSASTLGGGSGIGNVYVNPETFTMTLGTGV